MLSYIPFQLVSLLFMIYIDFYLFINFFSFCLVLDLRLKLTYHKNNNWEDKFIAEAQKTVSDLYEGQYVAYAASVVDEDENHNEDSDDDLFSYIYKKWQLSNNKNELDLYLRILAK